MTKNKKNAREGGIIGRVQDNHLQQQGRGHGRKRKQSRGGTTPLCKGQFRAKQFRKTGKRRGGNVGVASDPFAI